MKFNFLMPLKGVATKSFNYIGGNWELSQNYKSGKFFKGFEIDVANIEEAYNILEENQHFPVFNIHGSIIEGTNKKKMVRRKRSDHPDGHKPTLTDRMLNLFCIDIDGYEINDIEGFISNHLPEPFHKADYIYQHSASSGLLCNSLKCHLFFWAKIPIHNLDLKKWVKQHNANKGLGNIIDESIYNAAQPIYTQRRVCEGADDPIDNFIGLIKKEGELDWTPLIDEVAIHITQGGNNFGDCYDISDGIKQILKKENYHNELNKLALSLVNKKVPINTIKEIMEGAMNAVDTKDKRWKDRYEDIGRSVDSAVEIVNNPTIEEILGWIQNTDEGTIQSEFATKCIKLSPIDRTIAITGISKKIGFGINDVKKTIKILEQENKKKAIEAAKKEQSTKRKEKGICEIIVDPTNSGLVSEKAGTILAKSAKKPEVYVMGAGLASVSVGVPKTIRQCSRSWEMGVDYPKIPIVIPYTRPFYSLAGRLEKDVVFTTEKGTDIEAPTRILHMIGEAKNTHFKPLTGIVEHPFVDGDWNLVQKPGYDHVTGLYTILHHKLKITQMDPKDAYEYLSEIVLAEFPFSSELDRVVAVSAFITSVQRPTIAGDSGMPGFGIVSPVQSSGKTTLAQLISYAIFNRPVAASSWSNDDEELGKHILAILQEGHSCVLFDNIKQGAAVQSGRLANAMSNDTFGGRQLGENKTIEVPSSVIWLFTGNGIQFVGDFATRVYPININPNMQDPNTRSFERENIGQWAMDNRKKILSAIISIILAGKNMKELGGSTRFKLWDKFVRRPLFKVSGIDVNEAVRNNQSDDPLQLAKYQLLQQLYDQFKFAQFTTKDIIQCAKDEFIGTDTSLGLALDDILYGKAKNTMSVGRFLGTIVNVVLHDLVLKKKISNVVYWRVIKNEA